MLDPTKSPGMSPELRAALEESKRRVAAMAPGEYEAMIQAQRESWIRAMDPCEHGDPDWETCPKCRGWEA